MQQLFNKKIEYLAGVGPKNSTKLKKLGIFTIADLLYYFPKSYIDFNTRSQFSRARIGDIIVIKGKILNIKNTRTSRRYFTITEAKVGELDSLDKIKEEFSINWFNQPYLKDVLVEESIWYFYGKVKYDFKNKKKILLSPLYEKKSGILPIYSLTAGITSKYLRKLITPILKKIADSPDFLPEKIKSEEKLVNLDFALTQIHFPTSMEKLCQAKKRLAFDELLLIILYLTLTRQSLASKQAPSISISKQLLLNFVRSLPYQLTNAQRRASWEIINDLNKNVPMNRMLEGDVGSGKTVVALMAALNVAKSGYQVLWMAPTEILANQHYKTTLNLLKKYNFHIVLLTSNNRKQITKNELSSANIIIGTHALLNTNNQFADVGLVIIDEQHRFGVKQRQQLIQMNNSNESQEDNSASLALPVPHFLSMTATPIPRTLALSIYSDLDISILDEKPCQRKEIITRLVDPINRSKAYDFISKQIDRGRQVFIICPLIEQKTDNRKLTTENQLFDLDRKSVKAEFDRLSKEVFPNYKIAMLHGKMPTKRKIGSDEKSKQQIMEEFKDKKYDILISTSVIEVGIDIPNASIILIEDAEHFGLAQLHQFRGRVGRGEYQSYCFLFTQNLSPKTQNRLKKLESCTDGFKLAEEDLALRGPGELVGTEQSGLVDLKLAKLTDIIMINSVKKVVAKILQNDIKKYPELLKKIKKFSEVKHLE